MGVAAQKYQPRTNFRSTNFARVNSPDVNTPRTLTSKDLSQLHLRTIQSRREISFTLTRRHYQQQTSITELAARIANAKTKAERDDLLNTNRKLVNTELVRALMDAGLKIDEPPNQLTLLEFIRPIAEQLGDEQHLVRVLVGLGKVNLALNKDVEAERFFNEVADNHLPKDNVAEAGDLLLEIGDAHNSYNRFDQGAAWYRRVLTLLQSATGKEIAFVRGGAWLGLAAGQSERGQFDQALLSLQTAEEMFKFSGNKEILGKLYGERGILYDFLGNAELAKESYTNALNAFVGSHDEKNKINIAKVKINLGLLQATRLGEDAAAVTGFKEALVIGADELNNVQLASTYANMAIALNHLKNYPDALKYAKLSRDLFEKQGVTYAVINQDNEIAGIKLGMNQLEEALRLATDAAERAGALNNSDLKTIALINRGRTLHTLRRLGEANAAFAEAIKLIEEGQLHAFGNEEAQSGFFEEQVYAYRDMVDLLIDQGNASEALKYTERYKARALLGTLVNGRSDFTQGMTDEERQKEQALETSYAEINSKVLAAEKQTGTNASELSNLRTERARLRQQQQDFYLTIYATHAELRKRRAALPELTDEQLATLLPDAQSAALQYVVSEFGVFLIVITKDATNAIHIEPYKLTSDPESMTNKIHNFRSRLEEAPRAGFVPFARELENLLIEKARAQLAGKEYLIVIPDESLWELPFQALLTPDKKYLIEKHAISYAPSLTALYEMQRSHEIHSDMFLGIGNTDIGLKRGRIAQRRNLRNDWFKPLPQAEKQVDDISKIFPNRNQVHNRADATEARFKKEASGARIVHIAAHGSVNSATPMYSFVLLSQVGNVPSEDGVLEAWELMNIPLNADLVVLSACETARGRVRPGEGIIGLSWAVAIAGCPSIVSSQWKVDPASTTTLMKHFYESLYSKRLKLSQSGEWTTLMSKARALQKAETSLLTGPLKYRHPHFWAGFIVIGDAR